MILWEDGVNGSPSVEVNCARAFQFTWVYGVKAGNAARLMQCLCFHKKTLTFYVSILIISTHAIPPSGLGSKIMGPAWLPFGTNDSESDQAQIKGSKHSPRHDSFFPNCGRPPTQRNISILYKDLAKTWCKTTATVLEDCITHPSLYNLDLAGFGTLFLEQL